MRPRDSLQHANEANEDERRQAAEAIVAPFSEPCWVEALLAPLRTWPSGLLKLPLPQSNHAVCWKASFYVTTAISAGNR